MDLLIGVVTVGFVLGAIAFVVVLVISLLLYAAGARGPR